MIKMLKSMSLFPYSRKDQNYQSSKANKEKSKVEFIAKVIPNWPNQKLK